MLIVVKFYLKTSLTRIHEVHAVHFKIYTDPLTSTTQFSVFTRPPAIHENDWPVYGPRALIIIMCAVLLAVKDFCEQNDATRIKSHSDQYHVFSGYYKKRRKRKMVAKKMGRIVSKETH